MYVTIPPTGLPLILLIFLLSPVAHSKSNTYKDASSLAMGGVGVAQPLFAYPFNTNPAFATFQENPWGGGASFTLDLGDIRGISRDGRPLWQQSKEADLTDFNSIGEDSTLIHNLNKFDRRPWQLQSLPELFFLRKVTDDLGTRVFGLQAYLGSTARLELDKGVYIPSGKGFLRNTINIRSVMATEAGGWLHLGISPYLRSVLYNEQSVSLWNFETLSDSVVKHVAEIKSNIKRPPLSFGLDMGLVTDPLPKFGGVMLGAVIENIGFTESADGQPLNINLGISRAFHLFTLYKGMPLMAATSLEYHHINRWEPYWKNIHLGGQIGFSHLQIRTGVYQGYPSWGLGVYYWIVGLEMATWSREGGVTPGQAEEKHFVIGLKLAF